MIEELIEALLGESGTNSLCGRLKVEPWALFFSEKGRLAAEEAARALRLLRAEVKVRGYGCTVLKSVWRENSAALPDEYALLAFGAGRGEALRLAGGRFAVAVSEGAAEGGALPLQIFAADGGVASEGEEPSRGAGPVLMAVYAAEPPRPSYFRTKEVFLPLFRRGNGAK